MKKILVPVIVFYFLFCGYKLSSSDRPGNNDVIITIEVPVRKTGKSVAPDLDKAFDTMVFSKSVSYDNADPGKASKCIIEIRIPSRYESGFLNTLKKNYPNCIVVSVKAVPVPTPTALPSAE